MFNRRMSGATLVELVIAMVIMAVALAGLVAAFTRANHASVDPVVTQQMLAIAESMMEEVLLKPFEPDVAAAATRAQFNDVRDFDPQDQDAAAGYASNGIRDIDGNPIDGLASYNVSVRVNRVALTSVPDGEALRVVVTVSRGAEQLALTGWRTRP